MKGNQYQKQGLLVTDWGHEKDSRCTTYKCTLILWIPESNAGQSLARQNLVICEIGPEGGPAAACPVGLPVQAPQQEPLAGRSNTTKNLLIDWNIKEYLNGIVPTKLIK